MRYKVLILKTFSTNLDLMSLSISKRAFLFIYFQTKIGLEICREVHQHPEGSVSIMEQSECPDVWNAACCHPDRY